MTQGGRISAEQVSEWARKRFLMALGYLDWLAETARLDPATVKELDRLYAGLNEYAKLGEPLRDCSWADIQRLASSPALLIRERDLSAHVKSALAMPDGTGGEVERRFLQALLRRPLR